MVEPVSLSGHQCWSSFQECALAEAVDEVEQR